MRLSWYQIKGPDLILDIDESMLQGKPCGQRRRERCAGVRWREGRGGGRGAWWSPAGNRGNESRGELPGLELEDEFWGEGLSQWLLWVQKKMNEVNRQN